ncbi:MFS transporter, LAT3 family, solute carrier family 43, member 3 [Exophiala viscosa]|uniref:MFS transporter, LAT3 family, solute carrier family 43, member 3 n=1 Tax=Exophiala viscosa TaxID=2486360 RepID=UPI00218ECF5A|nr:MFS transporter, LAT3 family, solute carrier family 43, member 3 [Exophiala viscosa]
MSLAQHVSVVEGFDEPIEADYVSLRLSRQPSLQLSYDPIPPTHGPGQVVEKLENIAAYEVSVGKRIAQILVGVISCVLASGIVFGFDALKTILVEEGVYRKYCTEEELRHDLRLCYLQDQKLNLTFIIASVTTNISALLVGRVLDTYGPRICGLISSVFLLLGSLCMAFAQDVTVDLLPAGSFLLSLGGTFTFVPSFHLANAFPQHQGLILALVTGAFDASASVFLIFRMLYQSTNGAFSPRHIFLVFLVVPVFIFITQLTIMPTKSYESRGELANTLEKANDAMRDVHDSDDELDTAMEVMRIRSERAQMRRQSITSINDLLGTPAQQEVRELKEDQIRVNSGVWGVLHGVPASKQIRTPWFILITLFTVLQMTRFNFFIATIYSQYVYMLNSTEAAIKVIEFFDLALPIGGLVTVPFIGALLDHTSTVAVLNLLVLLSTIIGVLGAVPTYWAAYANVTLFCLFRPLYYSAMSDYAAKVFGYATFGTVYGAIICSSGLFTFAQSGLQALLHDGFDDDPEPINLGLATAGLVLGVALVMYVDIQGRAMQRDRAFAAMDERRPLLQQQRSLRGRPIPTSMTAGASINGEPGLSSSLRASGSGATAGLVGVGIGNSTATDDPERHRLLDRPSRQALFDRALSTVQETREPETPSAETEAFPAFPF